MKKGFCKKNAKRKWCVLKTQMTSSSLIEKNSGKKKPLNANDVSFKRKWCILSTQMTSFDPPSLSRRDFAKKNCQSQMMCPLNANDRILSYWKKFWQKKSLSANDVSFKRKWRPLTHLPLSRRDFAKKKLANANDVSLKRKWCVL